MRYYRLIDENGDVSFVSRQCGDDPPAAHLGQPDPVEVPRAPRDFEDWVDGEWVTDHAAAADHQAGPAAIAAAHIAKVIEARLLVVNGIDVEGVLSAEAKALSVSLVDLAGSVLKNAQTALEAEVARRVQKEKGKENGN